MDDAFRAAIEAVEAAASTKERLAAATALTELLGATVGLSIPRGDGVVLNGVECAVEYQPSQGWFIRANQGKEPPCNVSGRDALSVFREYLDWCVKMHATEASERQRLLKRLIKIQAFGVVDAEFRAFQRAHTDASRWWWESSRISKVLGASWPDDGADSAAPK